MLQFEVTVIPLSIQTDSGEVAAGEDESPQPAVLQNLITESGIIRIVLPVEHIDEVVSGLLKAKEQCNTPKPKADIYIPKSTDEIEQVAKAHRNINQGKS